MKAACDDNFTKFYSTVQEAELATSPRHGAKFSRSRGLQSQLVRGMAPTAHGLGCGRFRHACSIIP